MTIAKKGFLWVLFGLVLVGCSQPSSPTPTFGATSGPGPLANTYWNLIRLNGQPLISGTRILLQFSSNTFTGDTGCNGYGGPYDITGQQVIFQITVVGCYPDLMAQEKAYADTLSKFLPFKPDKYQLTTNNSRTQLDLLDTNSQPILVYEEVTQVNYNLLSAATYQPPATPSQNTPKPSGTSTSPLTPTPLSSATPEPAKMSLGQPVWAGRGQIVDAAFLPDGYEVAVGWGSGVSLNALDSGREVWFAPGPAPLIKIDLQPQGKAVAAAFTDGSLMVIDIASGKARLYPANVKAQTIWGALAWSPNSKILAYQLLGGYRNDPIYLLDVATGQVSQVPGSTINEGVMASLLWSPDNRILTLAGLGATCPRLVDVSTGADRMHLDKPDGCLVAQFGAWTPDGSALAVVDPAGNVDLLSFPDGARLSKMTEPGLLSAHPRSGQPLFFNANGRWLASRSGIAEFTYAPYDQITIWDAASGAIVARDFHPVTTYTSFYRVTAAFEGDSLLMLYSDGAVSRWNFLQKNEEQPLLHLAVPAALPWTLSWSRDGRRLAFTGSSGGVFVVDTASGQAVAQFLGTYDSPALSRDGSLLALSDGSTHEQQVIDLASGKVTLHLPGKGLVGGAAFSPDGSFLAYSLGEHAAVADLATGKSLELLPSTQSTPGPHNRVTHLVWAPDSQSLVVATGGGDQENGKVVLWQRETTGSFLELTRVVEVNANYPMSIVALFNPSGSQVALQGIPNNEANQLEVDVYDLRQRTIVQSAKGYLAGQWVDDGNLLMIEAAGDCRLTLLDLTRGQKTTGQANCAGSNLYAPGGEYYAQSDQTGITLFDWASGKTLGRGEHGSSLNDASWSPDGGWIATVGSDGTVRVWPVSFH